MYHKRCTGEILVYKSVDYPSWVKWVHHSEGKTHCAECLKLDGCFFTLENHPSCPHHPYCHCTLEPVGNAVVLLNAAAHSDYGKFDPYLFNTTGIYPHHKEKLFKAWGYTVVDAKWLQAEMERQGLEKYIAGDYQLGKLNDKGQRISIRITIPRRDNGEKVSFLTGWMVLPSGNIRLTTPYGGK